MMIPLLVELAASRGRLCGSPEIAAAVGTFDLLAAAVPVFLLVAVLGAAVVHVAESAVSVVSASGLMAETNSRRATVMPHATLYHFGMLESNVHMAWMRSVCGRLKSDYDYSIKIVYKNYPWPEPTEAQKQKIEQTAQAILDARAKYPDSSLADLYDELTMPVELRKAHQANDKAVWEAYGKAWNIRSESDCVAYLMQRYKKLTEE